jgi:SSS family solute:Na+ symporter
MLELIIVIVYFLVVITVGLYNRSKANSVDDFLVAGRKGSSLFITGSLLATIVGGSATIGMAGLGFSRGLTGSWWLLTGTIGLVVLGIFLAKKVRNFALYTIPEIIEKQYDGRVALAGSVLIVISWVGIVAGQIVAAGKIMTVLTIGTPLMWMAIFAFVFVVYTILGGQHAIIRTDTLQASIIFIGVFAGLGFILNEAGGFDGLRENLPANSYSFPLSSGFDAYELIKLLFLVGLTYVVGPDMYTRIFCARNGEVARKSTLWAGGLLVPFAFAIVIIGMGAAAIFPDIAAEQAFPTVIKEVLPPFVSGIVLAALLCAVMSSADTCLLSASTILTVDIIKKFKPMLDEGRILSLSRWMILVIGAGAMLVAWKLGGVISSLLFAYTVYTSGLVLPVLFGFYKDKLKVTSAGALAAMVCGGTAALVSELADIKYLDLGSLLISVLVLFGVSLFENWFRSPSRPLASLD